MSARREFVVESGGARLDVCVAERLPDVSRSMARRLVESGRATLDGAAAKPSARVRAGQRVVVEVPRDAGPGVLPQSIPLDIVHQDDHIIVVDKPAGLTTHPSPTQPDGTLLNALLDVWPDLPREHDAMRRGIVHRLDKDTSGLLVVARTGNAYANLTAQLKRREFYKVYLALARGRLAHCRAVIESPIGRDPRNRQRMAVVANGREAVTRYKTLTRYEDYTFVEVTLVTGRTHQIRVHFASLGHPLAGDRAYGRAEDALPRQFLHAARLGFRHPASGEWVEFASELPRELAAFLRAVSREPVD